MHGLFNCDGRFVRGGLSEESVLPEGTILTFGEKPDCQSTSGFEPNFRNLINVPIVTASQR